MERSEIMRRVKAKNTSIEIEVRKLLWSMGYRYRLHGKELPGKPDIVFTGKKKVIFVNGCFWHGHNCKKGNRLPKTNTRYWAAKIESTIARDRCHMGKLRDNGWDVSIIWECEVYNSEIVTSKLIDFLEH